MTMETTRSYSRSLEQAFGPYARGSKLYPMGSDKFKPRRRKMAPALKSYLIAAVVCGVAALTVVVCR